MKANLLYFSVFTYKSSPSKTFGRG